MKKYRVSRFRQLIWPQELFIDKYHALTRKRHFPSFWRVTEESIPLSKLASIQIHRGFVFSKLIIENSGGPFPIVVNGLWNRHATEARYILEKIEQEMQSIKSDEILGLIDEDDDSGDDGITPDNDPVLPPDSSAVKPEPEVTGVKQIAAKLQAKADRREKVTQSSLPVDEIIDNLYYGESPVNYDDNWDFGEDDPVVPNVVSYNIEHPPAEDLTEVAEEKAVWKVGQVDADWTPAPPWAPAKTRRSPEPEYDEPIREVDPVEFLHENAVAVETRQPQVRKPDNSRKAQKPALSLDNGIDTLVGFWNKAREEVTSVLPTSGRNKRKLQ